MEPGSEASRMALENSAPGRSCLLADRGVAPARLPSAQALELLLAVWLCWWPALSPTQTRPAVLLYLFRQEDRTDRWPPTSQGFSFSHLCSRLFVLKPSIREVVLMSSPLHFLRG